jgi:HEAT repeat protein
MDCFSTTAATSGSGTKELIRGNATIGMCNTKTAGIQGLARTENAIMERFMKSTSKRKKPSSLRDLLQSETDAELLLVLEKPNQEMQARVCFELGRRQSKTAVESIRRRLTSKGALVREAAAEALGQIGDSSAGDDLLRLFSDEAQPVPVRDTCAYALGRLAYKPALPKLLASLSDPSPTVRSCVVAALSAMGDAKIRGPVEIALQAEGDVTVRRAMQSLLEKELAEFSAAKKVAPGASRHTAHGAERPARP